MYLYEMVLNYPRNLKVKIHDNGTCIFNGVIATIERYIDANNLACKVEVYINELDEMSANVYLQR